MSMPLIAIAPQREAYLGTAAAYIARRRYCDYVEVFGATPFIMTYGRHGIRDQEKQLMELADGFMLLGGDLAIDPAEYGESIILSEIAKPPYREDRDICEQQIVRYAHEHNKPILGICRGMQIMNVAMGGTLYQDLDLRDEEEKSNVNHFQFDNRFDAVHDLTLTPDGLLASITKETSISVNSIHRQAVKDIGVELEGCAFADDGICEAIWAPSCDFMLGIQFHPSFRQDDPVSIAIAKTFVKACETFHKNR